MALNTPARGALDFPLRTGKRGITHDVAVLN